MILWAPAPSRKRRPCGVCRPRRAAVRTGRVCMAKCGGRFVDTCTGKAWENCTKWGLNFGDVQNFPNRFIGSPLHQFSQDFRFQKICRPAMPCTSVTSRATGGGSRGSRGHPPWSCARLPWLWAWEPPSGCNAGDGDGALGAQRHVWSLGNLGTHSSRLLPIFSSGDISPHSFFTQVLVSTCVHICPTLKHAEL